MNLALRKAIANLPRRVRVLADVERWIQRERARAYQQHGSQLNAQRNNGSCSSVRSHHISQYCLIVAWASETPIVA
jgi:hypothetical protein